jgi:hypothetical protein
VLSANAAAFDRAPCLILEAIKLAQSPQLAERCLRLIE